METGAFLRWLPYILISIWGLYALYYLLRGFYRPDKVNPFLLSAIPSVFTTLGVLGTFIGIAVGLEKFDVNNIDASIPPLLEGMKTAFYSSIIGIGLSLISARFVEYLQRVYSKTQPQKISGEEQAIYELTQAVERLQKLISSDSDESLSTHLVKLRQAIRDESKAISGQIAAVEQSLGGDGDTSLLSQTILFRNDNHEQLLKLKQSVEQLGEAVNAPAYATRQMELLQEFSNRQNNAEAEKAEMYQQIFNQLKNNNLFIQEELDKFADLLAKNNTEALVQAIENVIGGFNERLNELLERLVKENFEQLNNSVQQLNTWQKENKEMVEKLVVQFHQVSEDFTTSSGAIKDISSSTKQLVDDDGRLSRLIKELEAVMTDETKFRESIEQLHRVTSSYESTWDKANQWMEKHQGFTESVEELIESLREIEALRNQTEGFFNDIKEQLSESVGILQGGNEKLLEEVNTLNNAFYERLDQSFHSLDKILQSMVMGYANRLKAVN